MTEPDILRTIDDFATCAVLAREAGYDGVEIMGSEGYLINEFTALRTNDRTDDWGGTLDNRLRFPIEIMRRVRQRLGPDFIVISRVSSIDLVEGGLTAEEIITQVRAIEAAGANIINTGIGWHEARIPTIMQKVPRAAWASAAKRIKDSVGIPVIASNRISTPDVAESILSAGEADLVSMARPWLADPEFMRKVRERRTAEINVCIACNQACLDYIFSERVATCLVNPKAGREIEFEMPPPANSKRIAIVGAGPAGLACATTAADRGHRVTLYEAGDRIGGQLNLARNVPGKEEFDETLRYWRTMLAKHRVTVMLDTRPSPEMLSGFDEIVIATGVIPRVPDIPGVGTTKCVSYPDILSGRVTAGKRVAIVGAGGIGFDVAEYLTAAPAKEANGIDRFLAEWGVDPTISSPGGLTEPRGDDPGRQIVMLQRKAGRMGRSLGVSTGWALRLLLAKRAVSQLSGVSYRKIDEDGLHIAVGGEERMIAADTIVVCAGQEPDRSLHDQLAARGVRSHLIGGAKLAVELDAMRAIDEGTRLAYSF
jgi:2,4-dienoyl-CoA reductase (NADPH2)